MTVFLRFLALLPLAATLSLALPASAGDNSGDDAKPRFADPDEHSPSRIVSQPGGSPYYLPPSVATERMHVMDNSSDAPGNRTKRTQ